MTLSKHQEHAAIILLSAGAGKISLAGGAALIVHNLVDRTTQDLDAFSRPHGNVSEIAGSVISAFASAGYVVQDVSEADGLRTLMVSRQRRRLFGRPSRPVKIQIGRDFQLLESVPSPVGQTLDPVELAANKVLTVYDRPRARDADDIARLVPRFGLRRILEVADRKQVEPPVRVELANSFRMLQRIQDREFPYPENAASVKRFMGAIAQSVESGLSLPDRGPYPLSAQRQPRTEATGRPDGKTGVFTGPSTPFGSRHGGGGICGAKTKRGGVCRNPAGSCPYH